MDSSKIKSKVLQEIMDLMDGNVVEGLKSKSPKFAKVDIQSDDPTMANKLKDKLMNGLEEDSMEDPSKEMDMSDIKEDVSEGEDPFAEQDHKAPEDDADMQRLLEMYKNLK